MSTTPVKYFQHPTSKQVKAAKSDVVERFLQSRGYEPYDPTKAAEKAPADGDQPQADDVVVVDPPAGRRGGTPDPSQS